MIGCRSGRIDLAWLLAAGFGGGLLVVLLLMRLPAHERTEEQGGGVPSGHQESASLAEAIRALDQRLARIEASLAVQDSRGTREPADPSAAADGAPAQVSSAPADLDELHRDLLQMSKRIDGLAESLRENHKPAYSMPTLEQIHAARRDVDWAFIEAVHQLDRDNPSAAFDRVRLMTFDDLLKKVGVPTKIIYDDGGQWSYTRLSAGPNGQQYSRGIRLTFVGDCVSEVTPVGE